MMKTLEHAATALFVAAMTAAGVLMNVTTATAQHSTPDRSTTVVPSIGQHSIQSIHDPDSVDAHSRGHFFRTNVGRKVFLLLNLLGLAIIIIIIACVTWCVTYLVKRKTHKMHEGARVDNQFETG